MSHNLQANYAIRFFIRLDLILYACKIPFRCDSFEILNFATKQSHSWSCMFAVGRQQEENGTMDLQNDDPCSACPQLLETISHILVGCVLACEVWFKLLRRWTWQRLTPSATTIADFAEYNGERSRKQIHKDRRNGFDTQ